MPLLLKAPQHRSNECQALLQTVAVAAQGDATDALANAAIADGKLLPPKLLLLPQTTPLML
jgi:hypothetical protein